MYYLFLTFTYNQLRSLGKKTNQDVCVVQQEENLEKPFGVYVQGHLTDLAIYGEENVGTQKRPAIFMQESWRREINKPKENSTNLQKLSIKFTNKGTTTTINQEQCSFAPEVYMTNIYVFF